MTTAKDATLLNLPFLATSPFPDPFSDTPTMAGRRGRKEKSDNPTHVASPTSTLSNDHNTGLYPGVTHNASATTRGGRLLEKQDVTSRQMMVNKEKQKSFAEEANVEFRSINDVTGFTIFDKETMNKRSIQHNLHAKRTMPTVHNSNPLSERTVPHENPIVDQQQMEATLPGTLAMFPGGIVGPFQTPPNVDVPFVNTGSQAQLLTTIGANDNEADELTLNAFLVDESSVLASATLFDIEAEKNFYQRHRITAILGTVIIASIIATVVAVPVVLTRPGPSLATGSPSASPVPSETISISISLTPPCPGICPDGSNLTLPDKIVPASIATCGNVDMLAKQGFNETFCDALKPLASFCGCSGFVANFTCTGICANGNPVLNPDRSIPNYPQYTCRTLDDIVTTYVESECTIIQNGLSDFCGCSMNVSVESRFCSGVCPEGSNLTLPDKPAFSTTCGDLDLYGKFSINDTECEFLQAAASLCGCSGYISICPGICSYGEPVLYPNKIFPDGDNNSCVYNNDLLQLIDNETECAEIQMTYSDFCGCSTIEGITQSPSDILTPSQAPIR